MTWTLAPTPSTPSDAEYVVNVGGYRYLARWNDKAGRWFSGFSFIDPQYVRGFYELPEFPAQSQSERG